METHFSKEQLKDKNNKSSEKNIRKCVHCGFCNATCPTYQLSNKFKYYIDWGGALIWVEALELSEGMFEAIRKKVVKLGGYVTMIKNSNYLPYVEDVFTISSDKFNISQNIKKSFDPKRILNPGKMYTGI